MFYTQSTLDRADHLRKIPEAIAALRQADNTRLIPVYDGKSFIAIVSGTPVAMMLPATSLSDEMGIFLGKEKEHNYFAVDVSRYSEQALADLQKEAIDEASEAHMAEYLDLRRVGPLMDYRDGSLLAYARGLVFWNANTLYCTRCGNMLIAANAGHVRTCTACQYSAFPRTDPAVIMLVTYSPPEGEDLCLLGRSPAWPEGAYSTLAGFVEPGESLEMAVQREVLEEASIKTNDVRYVASQPWPFPRSIMLGFEARATTTEITCDPTEIADAQWFTREQLRSFGDWADESEGYKLPRTDSIARHLIDRWLAAEA